MLFDSTVVSIPPQSARGPSSKQTDGGIQLKLAFCCNCMSEGAGESHSQFLGALTQFRKCTGRAVISAKAAVVLRRSMYNVNPYSFAPKSYF